MPPADVPDRDSFAALVIDQLHEAGETAEITYDAEAFRLSAQSDHSNIANLSNLYDEYLKADLAQRDRLVRNYVRSWFAPLKGLPEEFEDVHPDLLPSVRPRAYVELNLLRLRMQGVEHPAWPYLPLAGHLAVCLVYDLPESLMQIQQQHLDAWGVSFDDALEQATGNLIGISNHRFDAVAPGVWRSPWKDNLDASRLVLTDLLRAHEVEGDPVVLVPNRDTLLLTGSDDEAGLSHVVELATEAFEQSRPISGLAVRLVGESWEPFVPDNQHPAYEAFRLLTVRSLGGDYSDQKSLLEAMNEQAGEGVSVADYSAMRAREIGEVFSYCVWSEGVDALLPRTDVVVFFRLGEGKAGGKMLGSGSWKVVEEVVGDLLTPLGIYPERYRTRGFPTAEQLAALAPGG